MVPLVWWLAEWLYPTLEGQLLVLGSYGLLTGSWLALRIHHLLLPFRQGERPREGA